MNLRAQLVIAFVVLAVGPTLVFGKWASDQAGRALEHEAMRSVGIKADARRQALRALLLDRRSRLQTFLATTRGTCPASAGADAERQCIGEALADFAAVEGVGAARLRRGHSAISFGDAALLPAGAGVPAGQLARLALDDGGSPYVLLEVRAADDELVVRQPLAPVEQIFHDTTGLGQRGETFLTDNRGVFLTSPRHPTAHAHESHPIDAQPMKTCLAGVDAETRAADYRGVDVIHGFRHLPDLGGACIMAHLDPREATAGAARLKTHVGLAGILVAVVAALTASVLARSITRPISALSRAAERLGRGEQCPLPAVPRRASTELCIFTDTFAAMARGITEARQGLECAARARKEVLAVVCHDLRNPLASVDLQARLLLDGVARNPPSSCTTITAGLQRIRRASARMTRLVSDLLDAAAIENGTLSVDARDCEAAGLLREGAECLESAAQQKSIRLTVDVAADMPTLCCDRDRILQVLTNLSENAIKFTNPGGIVTIGARRRGERVEISVNDDGVGIPAESIPRLFEPFWHADRRSGGGTGLGLFIAHGLVAAHGGELRVESAPGQGTRFSFDIAAAERASEERDEVVDARHALRPLDPSPSG